MKERVEQLFEELCELDEAAIAARLSGEEPEVRARVSKLLAHDRAAPSAFLKPFETTLLDDEPPQIEAPVASGRIGRYLVLRELGRGGMGVVYVAYDESLDRRVALKVLRQGLERTPWLKTEAQALARIQHPNVVHVHEIADHEGHAFVAMELVEGETLRAWLSRSHPEPDVLRMLIQAGRGLAAAHAAGVVHRDFKPDNVLVGKDGRARVVDFGLASVVERPERGGLALAGTPGFMAPEQILGEPIGPEADQFAFAVVVFRAVFGVAPFEGDGVAQRKNVLEGNVVTPKTASWLLPILKRALSRVPTNRFESMDVLLAELAAHVPSDPDMDPHATRRGRLQLLSVLLVFGAGLSLYVQRGSVRDATELLRIAAVVFLLIAGATAVLFRRLAKNTFGRKAAAAFVAIAGTMLAHRLIAFHFGLSVPITLVTDMTVIGSMLLLLALTLDRRFGPPALPYLVGAAVTFVHPTLAIPMMSASSLLCFSASFYVWSRTS